MLDDRDYMRAPDVGERNATKKLIIILIVCFVVQSCFAFYGDINFPKHLALSVDGVTHGKVWQFFTFQFLHSVPWPFHVLFNCLGLYFFGRSLEGQFGTTRFLKIYFTSGVAGACLHILCVLVLPRHADIPVVGASAGVYGVMAAFCALFPMRELTTFIYFFPVNIRASYLLWFLGLFALYGTIVPFDYVAHGAHLGGLLMGIAWVRWTDQLDRLFSFPQIPLAQRRQQPGATSQNYEATTSSPNDGVKTVTNDDFISKEVDPILDKISAHGIHSLTERERKILEKARAAMAKRS
ncbi:MAG: rhomboid family intramembrane serine protease [Verrucomicrobia bacterium]|nr:rhomboid family intramembrane serine protease [Verrucomicrobiota bacterium]